MNYCVINSILVYFCFILFLLSPSLCLKPATIYEITCIDTVSTNEIYNLTCECENGQYVTNISTNILDPE